jgi:hypothetical protein
LVQVGGERWLAVPQRGTVALRYGGVVLGVNYAARQHTPAGLGRSPPATSSRRRMVAEQQRPPALPSLTRLLLKMLLLRYSNS